MPFVIPIVYGYGFAIGQEPFQSVLPHPLPVYGFKGVPDPAGVAFGGP